MHGAGRGFPGTQRGRLDAGASDRCRSASSSCPSAEVGAAARTAAPPFPRRWRPGGQNLPLEARVGQPLRCSRLCACGGGGSFWGGGTERGGVWKTEARSCGWKVSGRHPMNGEEEPYRGGKRRKWREQD